MKTHLMFTLLAAATVASPGPGVLMTLTNTMQHGLPRALPGILGIAMGSMATAAVSASGAGLMMASSPIAFAMLRYAGALYLLYLGWRLWQPPGAGIQAVPAGAGTPLRLWWEGVSLQFTNPKSLLFFLSVLPQFIDPAQAQAGQFIALVLTYSLLVVLVHGGYALMARRSQRWFARPRSGLIARRASGTCFIVFGASLALMHT